MALETIGSGRWWPRALRRLSLVADLEAESAREDKVTRRAWPCANRMVRNVLRSGWSPLGRNAGPPGLPASDDWTDMGW